MIIETTNPQYKADLEKIVADELQRLKGGVESKFHNKSKPHRPDITRPDITRPNKRNAFKEANLDKPETIELTMYSKDGKMHRFNNCTALPCFSSTNYSEVEAYEKMTEFLQNSNQYSSTISDTKYTPSQLDKEKNDLLVIMSSSICSMTDNKKKIEFFEENFGISTNQFNDWNTQDNDYFKLAIKRPIIPQQLGTFVNAPIVLVRYTTKGKYVIDDILSFGGGVYSPSMILIAYDSKYLCRGIYVPDAQRDKIAQVLHKKNLAITRLPEVGLFANIFSKYYPLSMLYKNKYLTECVLQETSGKTSSCGIYACLQAMMNDYPNDFKFPNLDVEVQRVRKSILNFGKLLVQEYNDPLTPRVNKEDIRIQFISIMDLNYVPSNLSQKFIDDFYSTCEKGYIDIETLKKIIHEMYKVYICESAYDAQSGIITLQNLCDITENSTIWSDSTNMHQLENNTNFKFIVITNQTHNNRDAVDTSGNKINKNGHWESILIPDEGKKEIFNKIYAYNADIRDPPRQPGANVNV